jgi:hypothetical protein
MPEKPELINYAAPRARKYRILLAVALATGGGAILAMAGALILRHHALWLVRRYSYRLLEALAVLSLPLGVVAAVTAPIAWLRRRTSALERSALAVAAAYWILFVLTVHYGWL